MSPEIRTVTHTLFICPICDGQYTSKERAESCASRPLQNAKGVKVGDRVRITAGPHAGIGAAVARCWVANQEWGHYAADRYWHTVIAEVKLLDNIGGYTTLTFDYYELDQ